MIFKPFVSKNEDQILIAFKSESDFQYPSNQIFGKKQENLNKLCKILFKGSVPFSKSQRAQSGVIIRSSAENPDLTELVFYIMVEFTGTYVTYERQE